VIQLEIRFDSVSLLTGMTEILEKRKERTIRPSPSISIE